MSPARTTPARLAGRLARAAAALGLGLAACYDAEVSRGFVGQPAPPYAAADMAGNPVALADFAGEVVLLNVWATWCAPCRVETPELETLHRELAGEGLRVVGVSIDGGTQNEAVRAFMDEFAVSYTILRDPGERVSTVFAVHGVPVTVLIGRDGTVRWRHTGPVTADDPGLRAALAAALQERRTAG